MKRLTAGLAVLAVGLLVPVAATANGPVLHKTKVITVTMGEFYFKPNVIRLKAGEQATIVFTNRGNIPHEFMAGQMMKMEHGMPEGYRRDFFKGVKAKFRGTGEFESKPGHGTEVYLKPGESGTLTFTVPKNKKGTWKFGCFVPGHYQAGQKGTLVVR